VGVAEGKLDDLSLRRRGAARNQALGEVMRFAESPRERADAIAALTLVYALTHHLVETNRLAPDEIELIRALI